MIEDPSYKGMYLDSEIETGIGANKDLSNKNILWKMYQAIIKDFIGNYDGFYNGLYGDDN